MEKSAVFFTDFHATPSETLPQKLHRLLKRAGFEKIDFTDHYAAIKIHFGELGNLAHLRPQYAKVVVDYVRELGGKAFLADGLKGTNEAHVPINLPLVKEAKIGQAIMDADVVISLSHFKGHEEAGFGGALKNLGMGSGSRSGKMEQHWEGKPVVDPALCVGCGSCVRICAHGGPSVENGKAHINHDKCVGCGRCLAICPKDAIEPSVSNSTAILAQKIAEYAYAVVKDRPAFHISLICDVSPFCDCHAENDVPIIPDVGMLASFDPVALDQACVDLCNKMPVNPGSRLDDHMKEFGHKDPNHEYFHMNHPDTEWEAGLQHAEEIGLGSRQYELIRI